MTITLTRPETNQAGATVTDIQTDIQTDVQTTKSEQSGELKQQTLELLNAYQECGLPHLKDRIVRLNLGLARREAHYWAKQCQEN
jgi:DNA-directed RNA polymerase specialized sigma subunit